MTTLPSKFNPHDVLDARLRLRVAEKALADKPSGQAALKVQALRRELHHKMTLILIKGDQ